MSWAWVYGSGARPELEMGRLPRTPLLTITLIGPTYMFIPSP